MQVKPKVLLVSFVRHAVVAMSEALRSEEDYLRCTLWWCRVKVWILQAAESDDCLITAELLPSAAIVETKQTGEIQ